jgi:hypothetical protein
MQNVGFELPRIPVPRTPVNKGKKKGRCVAASARLVLEDLAFVADVALAPAPPIFVFA